MAAAEATEAGGILKEGVRVRFMPEACFTKRVELCAMQIPFVSKVSQMGKTLRMSFVSSTLVTVDNLHGFGFFSEFLSSIIAALSKHLVIESTSKLRSQE